MAKREISTTARPWRLSAARTAIAGDDNTKVADCNIGWHKDTPTANANAAFIVQAVNSFDAMRDALQDMRDRFNDHDCTQNIDCPKCEALDAADAALTDPQQ